MSHPVHVRTIFGTATIPSGLGGNFTVPAQRPACVLETHSGTRNRNAAIARAPCAWYL